MMFLYNIAGDDLFHGGLAGEADCCRVPKFGKGLKVTFSWQSQTDPAEALVVPVGFDGRKSFEVLYCLGAMFLSIFLGDSFFMCLTVETKMH
jgi:hypothetical protein